ncbi:MAG: leucine-rich repeat domain-containing protein [Bacillota bacterium]|nr:leucine-rich repeat domain-containing protein [Bacillota bacterium]
MTLEKKSTNLILILIITFACLAAVWAVSGSQAHASGPGKNAYINVWDQPNGGGYVYAKKEKTRKVKGFSYNSKSNTLTISGRKTDTAFLEMWDMGSTFKIKLSGKNQLAAISAYADTRAANITIGGTGSLILDKTNYNGTTCAIGIYDFGGNHDCKITINNGPEITMYKGDYSLMSVQTNKKYKSAGSRFSIKGHKSDSLSYAIKRRSGSYDHMIKNKKLTISRITDISKATVDVNDVTWNGKTREPKVKVSIKGLTLRSGTDYSVKYSNNKEPGTAKVKVTGKGKYKNSKTVTFKIKKAKQTINVSKNAFDMKSGKINKQKTVSLDIDRKESAKITLKSSNSSIAKAASGDEIKLLKPGRVKITVKTKETKHYKAGSKTVTVKVKGYQVVKLTGSIVKANVNGTYTLKKDVFVLPLGVQPCDNAKYTCRIYTNGKENQAWIESGDKVTAKGCGSFRLEVKTKKTELCPAASVIIPINMAGKIKIKNSWLYRQVDKNSLELLKYIGDSGNGAFRVPASIKLDSAGKKKAVKLGDSAMAGKKYTKVTIEDGNMKTIGKNALKGCTSLQTLRLPVSLTTIEEGAFYGCGKLTSLELPSKVKTIGKNAFNGCKSIKGELYLPLSLTAVKEGTFKGCAKISQLFVYHNLTKVEKNAFYGCSALKDVRYSAGKAQWKKISKASGNDPFKKVKMYNMAAPAKAYPAAKITDSNLYSSHPKNLMNKSYKYAMENAEDYLMTILCKETDSNLTWSAIKTTMMNGPVENIKAIFDGYLNDGRFTEEKVEKALAMELLRDAIEEDWTLGGAGKKIKETYDETKDNTVLTELRAEGSAIFKDNKTRYRFAQAMDKCVPGRQITKYNNILKKIQPHWNNVQKLYKGMGKGIEAYDFAVDVIMLNVYYTENLTQLMEIIPPSSTGLYNGLKLAKLKMDDPKALFMAEMLQDEILEQFASISFDKLLEHLDVQGGATVTVATTLFKVAGACIDVPKIGAFNDAWLSMESTRTLYSAYNRMNADMVNAGNGKPYQSKHKLVLSMYFTSLEKSAGYVEKIVQDRDKSVYVSEFMKRYKGGGFTYGAYVRSCKENYAEGHQ